jgi:hypothetical protein
MQPALATVKKIEHEYSLRDELDSAWAVRSLAVSEERRQTTLVLENRCVETLDRFLAAPMEMEQFLRFAVGFATPSAGCTKRELIHDEANHCSGPRQVRSGTWALGSLRAFCASSRLPDIASHSLTWPSKLGHEPHRDTRHVSSIRFLCWSTPAGLTDTSATSTNVGSSFAIGACYGFIALCFRRPPQQR